MKRRHKRIFSLIYVPDQDRDPKSFSMSYTRGQILLVLFSLLMVHAVIGAIGYYRIVYLENIHEAIETENLMLKTQNRQIERIVREFNDYRSVQEKIRMMHGITLGEAQESENWHLLDVPVVSRSISSGSRDGDVPLERIQSNITLLAEGGETYYNPSYLPTTLPITEGHITAHFQRGGWFLGRSHLGIDIAAKRGTTIRAAGAGIVVLADWTPDFGNMIIISHGRGLYSYYAHALRLLVNQGDTVRKGQGIALLGSSGISSAPHLHFEIWKDGVALNPEEYILALRRPGEGQ
ncbi:MAG TPA: M23 family metallopeptidase [bacterium]|nr:M23 family metallopeptidase [bacterium]